MDPGTILAVVQLSGAVLSNLVKYTKAVKGAATESDRLSKYVEQLRDALNRLEALCREHSDRVQSCATAIKIARDELSALNDLLKPEIDSKRRRLGIRSLKWPLKTEEVNRFIGNLERSKSTVLLALNTDQMLVSGRFVQYWSWTNSMPIKVTSYPDRLED
jgi:chromosome segregation ATPase